MTSAAEKLRAKIAPKVGAGNTAAVIQHPATADKPKTGDEFDLPDDLLAEVETEANLLTVSAVGAAIARLNAEHFVSVEGGKTRVYREAFDHELGRDRLDRMAVESFRALHSHETVPVVDKAGNPSSKQVAAVWLNHPARRTYSEGISLLPAGDTPAGVYNLWRGFGCEPKHGASVSDVKPALVYLLRAVCSGNRSAFEYTTAWLAHAVQHPERQAEVAIVLHGGRGTGKGTFGRWFRDLFGAHGMQIHHPRHLTGNFNAHLQTCLALFVDESFFVGDRAGNSVLKSVITEDQITVEKKGLDVVTVRNRLKIVMATNEDHAILAGEDERRYFVLHVSDCKKQDHAYFGTLNAWWSSGGKEAFLGYLLDYDLTGFNIRKVPNTAALERQKLQSLGPLGAWLFERLQEGRLCAVHGCGHPPLDWPLEQDRKNVAADFALYVKDHGHRYANTARDSVGFGIRKHIELADKREGTGERRRLWVFPPLDEARQQFASSLGLEHFKWSDGDDIEDGDDE
jgi:hypothetical protein